MVAGTPPSGLEPGAHERHIARSTLAQQAAQGVGVLAMLAVVTMLGRTLSLDAFGVYGLLLSIAAYMLIVQASVEGAAVRAMAGATDEQARARLFSTALALYAGFGVLCGALIAGVGTALVSVLGIPDALLDDAREGVLALGAVTALGWPFKVFQDALRASQRFFQASLGEIAAHIVFVAAMAALIAADAPLWAVIAVGGALPALTGLACAGVLVAARAPFRFRRQAVSRDTARELLGFSAHLSSIGIADLVVYSLDRVILAALRNTATVGLYEGVARAHALVRQLNGTLSLTVVPVASGYLAADDRERLLDLLLRGTRYVMAVVIPVCVTLMVLAEPLLEAWLGEEFGAAATALAIMLSYWLLGAASGVGGAMLVASGHVAWLNRYAWINAAMNLTLSLALTAWLGLEGVALGTAIPYVILHPFITRKLLHEYPVGFRRLVRDAWLPAYATGAALALALVLVRVTVPLESFAAVAVVCAAGVLAAWAAYFVVWLRPSERLLVRSLVGR